MISTSANGYILDAISDGIDNHAPFQKASGKQKRVFLKPWLAKGILL